MTVTRTSSQSQQLYFRPMQENLSRFTPWLTTSQASNLLRANSLRLTGWPVRELLDLHVSCRCAYKIKLDSRPVAPHLRKTYHTAQVQLCAHLFLPSVKEKRGRADCAGNPKESSVLMRCYFSESARTFKCGVWSYHTSSPFTSWKQ